MGPTLVIMAAGIGSRYGGLKQIDPVGPSGELIIDYSIYDAIRAGFGDVVFIITEEIGLPFREMIGDRISRFVPVSYVYQKLGDVPDGFVAPAERIKPWGTAHAVYSCRKLVDKPFVVLNADDYYGASVFKAMYDYMADPGGDSQYNCCMPGYLIENTLSEHGYVARGICTVDGEGYLSGITERTRVERSGGGIIYTENGVSAAILPGTTVSMNMFGFPAGILDEFEGMFRRFLIKNAGSLTKAEFFIPLALSDLLERDIAGVKVLRTDEKWFGVTYREDKKPVADAIAGLVQEGKYPQKLWPDS